MNFYNPLPTPLDSEFTRRSNSIFLIHSSIKYIHLTIIEIAFNLSLTFRKYLQINSQSSLFSFRFNFLKILIPPSLLKKKKKQEKIHNPINFQQYRIFSVGSRAILPLDRTADFSSSGSDASVENFRHS